MGCKWWCGVKYLLRSTLCFDAWIKVCRGKIANCIVQYNINIILIPPWEYGSRLEVHWNSLGEAANTLNSPQIWTSWWFDCVAFWRQPYRLQDSLGFCSTTSGALRSTREEVLKHLRAYRFALSLSGSIWEHLEGSVCLFRVAELFSYDFQIILYFADDSIMVGGLFGMIWKWAAVFWHRVRLHGWIIQRTIVGV